MRGRRTVVGEAAHGDDRQSLDGDRQRVDHQGEGSCLRWQHALSALSRLDRGGCGFIRPTCIDPSPREPDDASQSVFASLSGVGRARWRARGGPVARSEDAVLAGISLEDDGEEQACGDDRKHLREGGPDRNHECFHCLG